MLAGQASAVRVKGFFTVHGRVLRRFRGMWRLLFAGVSEDCCIAGLRVLRSVMRQINAVWLAFLLLRLQ